MLYGTFVTAEGRGKWPLSAQGGGWLALTCSMYVLGFIGSWKHETLWTSSSFRSLWRLLHVAWQLTGDSQESLPRGGAPWSGCNGWKPLSILSDQKCIDSGSCCCCWQGESPYNWQTTGKIVFRYYSCCPVSHPTKVVVQQHVHVGHDILLTLKSCFSEVGMERSTSRHSLHNP